MEDICSHESDKEEDFEYVDYDGVAMCAWVITLMTSTKMK